MNIDELCARKIELQNALVNTQQSYHIISGHINEIDYHIQKLEEATQYPEPDFLANAEEAHVE